MTLPLPRLAFGLLALAVASASPLRAAKTAKDRPPQLFRQRAPVHPASIANFRVRGEVRVTFDVEADGTVSNVRAGYATHPDFVAPAIAAVLDWRYRPALRDGRPVPTYDVKATVISDVVVIGGPAFTIPARGLDQLPPEFRYDEPPSIKTMVPPVYPLEMLAGGLPGRASVAFALRDSSTLISSACRARSRSVFRTSIGSLPSRISRRESSAASRAPVRDLPAAARSLRTSLPSPISRRLPAGDV